MEQLDFSKEYILENQVVRLQPLVYGDIDQLKEFSLNEPGLWEYSLLSAAGLENMQAYIKAALEDRVRKGSYPFLVYDKRRNAVAGSTRFYDFSETHSTTQLGYTWYGAEFQGTGLNKNCKLLLLEFAFETLGLERVEFRADNNNQRSIAAMKSIGCTVEGVLRSNCASPTVRRDSIVLSILKNEWFETVKSALKQKCEAENKDELNKGRITI